MIGLSVIQEYKHMLFSPSDEVVLTGRSVTMIHYDDKAERK